MRPSAACERPEDHGLPPRADRRPRRRLRWALPRGYSDVRLYRLGPDGCATLVATIDPGGTIAFTSIGEPQQNGMPELSIETWLMHGDRVSKRFRWSGDHYVETGRAVEIPGPRR